MRTCPPWGLTGRPGPGAHRDTERQCVWRGNEAAADEMGQLTRAGPPGAGCSQAPTQVGRPHACSQNHDGTSLDPQRLLVRLHERCFSEPRTRLRARPGESAGLAAICVSRSMCGL